MKRTLIETWQSILDGDPEAWEEIVEQYAALVYSTARHCGLANDEAEDCAQQTWMALYVGRKSLREPEKLPIWLISTATRTASRIRRKRSSRARAEQKAEEPAPETNPEEKIAQLQQRAVIEAALGKLDRKCRDLLRAMFYAPEDMSYRDIARELKIPFNSLGPVRMRCLKKLKAILENLDND